MTFQEIKTTVTICDLCQGRIHPNNLLADSRYWSVYNPIKNKRLHFHYECAVSATSSILLELSGAELHGT